MVARYSNRMEISINFKFIFDFAVTLRSLKLKHRLDYLQHNQGYRKLAMLIVHTVILALVIFTKVEIQKDCSLILF